MFLAFLMLIGVYFPRSMGLGFFDPHLTLAYACCGPFFQASVVAASVLTEPRTHFAEKLAASTLFGWFTGILFVVTGLIAVNSKIWRGIVALPDTTVLVGCIILGLCVSLFAAALYGVLALRQDNLEDAKKINRRFLFVTMILLVLATQNGPTGWRDQISERLNSDGMPFLLAALGVPLLLLSVALAKIGASKHRDSRSKLEMT